VSLRKGGETRRSPVLPALCLGCEFLQTIVNDAMVHGHLTRPLPLTCTPDFPIIQYANDTLVILLADVDQLIHLKSLLLNFGAATGLKVNYGKSNLVPINVGGRDFAISLRHSELSARESSFYLSWSSFEYYQS
jgi:hypothetical protein